MNKEFNTKVITLILALVVVLETALSQVPLKDTSSRIESLSIGKENRIILKNRVVNISDRDVLSCVYIPKISPKNLKESTDNFLGISKETVYLDNCHLLVDSSTFFINKQASQKSRLYPFKFNKLNATISNSIFSSGITLGDLKNSNVFFSNNNIKGINNAMTFVDSVSQHLMPGEIRNSKITFNKDSLTDFLFIFNFGGTIGFDDCNFSLPFNFNLQSSTLNGFSLNSPQFGMFDLNFSGDSINGGINLTRSLQHKHEHKQSSIKEKGSIVLFQGCYLNSHIQIIQEPASRVNLTFLNTTFGPNTVIHGLDVDSLNFINCTFMSKVNISIQARHEEPISLSVINTDIANLNISYLGSYKFCLPSKFLNSEFTEEEFIGGMESALAKYKMNGKTDSYKNLDIDYKHYMYSRQGVWGKFKSLVERSWWNYGYSKSLPIFWTIILLITFCIINTSVWHEITKVYDIPEVLDHVKYDKLSSNTRNNIRKYFSIALYTCFIFFSINIKFERLRNLRTRWTVLFLAEYVIGIICLFFIINAIFKL